ncbi:MAG: glycosyltransferase family 4 protein [Candidatus Omnitrophica bacterium]|nr:glycosyltransferase family 4 protein [Candidatus Omnitrophota bacterium]
MILYITRKFPPSVGGMQRFNGKLSEHLRGKLNLELIAWGGSQLILPFFLVYAFFKAIFLCLNRSVECIYVADGLLCPLGYVLKKITGKSVVVTIHGRDIAFELRVYQRVICWALKRMDKIICVSEVLKQECLKRNISEKIISVIPNGVDLADFNNQILEKSLREIEARMGEPVGNQFILLSVGRLVSKKGIDVFVKEIFPKILQQTNDVIYLIVGEGPLKNNIAHIIQQDDRLHHHVFLLGQIPMESPFLSSIYQNADIFVMPNVPVRDDMEGFGIVALEACAAGAAVVATQVDGVVQAVKNGENGIVIDHRDHQLFADTVVKLLRDPDRRLAMGISAKNFVMKNYSWGSISDRYVEQFAEASRPKAQK